jgi:protein-L-isoaspartate(D-aspartate) O-methyltransferase
MRLLPLILLWTAASAADQYTLLRQRMVREDIEARGIRNKAVIEAMRSTLRHLFVPESARTAAYADHPLSIGLGQTISQPYIVALMSEMLSPQPQHRVLEIGTGSGYQAAVLSPLVKDVYSMEVVEPLGNAARELLGRLGYKNVHVRIGDGYKGWPEAAPFDRVIVTAAPPEVPQALIDQLKPGGRLVAPVGTWDQYLIVIDKDSSGRIKRRQDIPVRFVPMVPARKD